MKLYRVTTLAVVAGVTVLAITFLTAANTSTNNVKPTQEAGKSSPASGVVVFGDLDVEKGVMPLFPETFPQPTKVLEVLVKEGDVVSKGAPLIKLDAESAQFSLEEAQLGLKAAQSQAAGAKAQLEHAKQMRDAQTIAQDAQQIAIEGKKHNLGAAKIKLAEQRRVAETQGIKNDAEIRAAQENLNAAQKEVDFEEKKLEGLRRVSAVYTIQGAQTKVDEAAADVERKSILIRKAEYGLRIMTMTAPSDGKILRTTCQTGLMVGPQTKQPLIWFQPAGNLIVRCEVDQEWASRVQKDQSAVITDNSNNNLTWKGKVTRISDSFLPKRTVAGLPDGFPMNDSRVLEVLVEIDKSENTSGLRMGQRVKVTIGLE